MRFSDFRQISTVAEQNNSRLILLKGSIRYKFLSMEHVHSDDVSAMLLWNIPGTSWV